MIAFHKTINSLINDNTSGSTAILNGVIEAVKACLKDKTCVDYNILYSELKRLVRYHPNFPVLQHFIKQLTGYAEENETGTLLTFVNEYENYWKRAPEAASRNFTANVDMHNKTVLLHSNSSAVRNLFGFLKKTGISPEVYQTFSSPAAEGKLQAAFLAKSGFNVKFIHEVATAKFIDSIDMAIFGADLITDEHFLNKTGTFMLSLLFQRFDKPVYVLTDSRKIISKDEIPEKVIKTMIFEERKPGDELWAGAPVNVKPVNYYFELTPNNLVRALCTENGFAPV